MGKRKSSSSHDKPSKKGTSAPDSAAAPPANDDVKTAFRDGLFDDAVLKEYNEQYRNSGPFVTRTSFSSSPLTRSPATRTPSSRH